MYGSWFDAALNVAKRGLETQGVVAQRVSIFALSNSKAFDEEQHIIITTLYAVGEAAKMMATGASNEDVIRICRRKIQANTYRLAQLSIGQNA